MTFSADHRETRINLPADDASGCQAEQNHLTEETKIVVGAALRHTGRILAAQRAYPEWARGMWELPGGKVQTGEDRRQALRRELTEEMHLTCPDDAHWCQLVCHESYDGLWQLHSGYRMAVYIIDFDTKPSYTLTPAHLDLTWANEERLAGLNWLPADAPIVQRLLEVFSDDLSYLNRV